MFGRNKGRKKDRFMGYFDTMGRPVYGYNIKAFTDNRFPGEDSGPSVNDILNSRAESIMESIQKPGVSNGEYAKGMADMDYMLEQQQALASRTLQEITEIIEGKNNISRRERKELKKIYATAQTDLMNMTSDRAQLKMGKMKRYESADDINEWIDSEYSVGSNSRATKPKMSPDEAKKAQKGKDRRGAADWAKMKNGSIRVTKRMRFGPFYGNLSTRGLQSAGIQLGPIVIRLFDLNEGLIKPRLTSMDMPGMFSYRPNNRRR